MPAAVWCSICFETASQEGDEPWSVTPCGHYFHTTCLQSALDVNNARPCPLCRVRIPDGRRGAFRLYHSFANAALNTPAPAQVINLIDDSPESLACLKAQVKKLQEQRTADQHLLKGLRQAQAKVQELEQQLELAEAQARSLISTSKGTERALKRDLQWHKEEESSLRREVQVLHSELTAERSKAEVALLRADPTLSRAAILKTAKGLSGRPQGAGSSWTAEMFADVLESRNKAYEALMRKLRDTATQHALELQAARDEKIDLETAVKTMTRRAEMAEDRHKIAEERCKIAEERKEIAEFAPKSALPEMPSLSNAKPAQPNQAEIARDNGNVQQCSSQPPAFPVNIGSFPASGLDTELEVVLESETDFASSSAGDGRPSNKSSDLGRGQILSNGNKPESSGMRSTPGETLMEEPLQTACASGKEARDASYDAVGMKPVSAAQPREVVGKRQLQKPLRKAPLKRAYKTSDSGADDEDGCIITGVSNGTAPAMAKTAPLAAAYDHLPRETACVPVLPVSRSVLDRPNKAASLGVISADNSGTFIRHGADGRGGRTTVLQPANRSCFDFTDLGARSKSKPIVKMTSKQRGRSVTTLENFFSKRP